MEYFEGFIVSKLHHVVNNWRFQWILIQKEKVGVRERGTKLIENFREALELCYLTNMSHNDDYFTWINKHSDSTFTKERLDTAQWPTKIGYSCMITILLGGKFGSKELKSQTNIYVVL